ncbi:hypothetical protein NQ315_000026 [Exocentrus adspersus]|uniref:Endonuclease/exonuclease/phosphatase domain-containing protein n=1 Tax=Exocentrus adspersus TaxID=1586481 RepID=A0AAV8VFV1_9CUCU|nr:hypothetical protein NQ315_000026 [Exocentrus adspersus]
MAVQRKMPESLRVASWNTDSFTARKHELQEFLTRLEIDVVALQETRLAENMSTKIPGYVVYRQDRNRQGGGVAVAIKRGIDHYMLQVPQLDTIEAVAVGIRTSRYGEIAVASCYHPPGRTILEQDIEALLTVGPRVIAIGDFNAKAQDWNSRQLNPSGAALRRFLENTVDVVAIGPIEPTFDGQGRFAPDVLDIALLKAIPAETDITSHHEGSSDHNPVLLTMGDPTPQGDIIVKRNTDWANFRAEMQKRTAIPRIETTDDLEAAVVSLETDIRTALERSTIETREVRQANYIGEIPLEAQQLIRDRRVARRRALRSGAPEHRRIANQLSRRVRAALDEHRQETCRQFVESLNPRDNSLWKTQKALKTRRRPVLPLHGEQGIVHTNRDKAEAFADSLELQCRENQLDDEDEEHTALVERRARQIGQTPDDEEIHRQGQALSASLRRKSAEPAEQAAPHQVHNPAPAHLCLNGVWTRLQDPPQKDPSSVEHGPENCGQCPLVRKEQRPAPRPGMDTGARSHQDQSRQGVSQSDGPRKSPPTSGGNHQDQANNGGPQSDIDFRTCPSPRTCPRITIPIPLLGLTLKSAWAAIP